MNETGVLFIICIADGLNEVGTATIHTIFRDRATAMAAFIFPCISPVRPTAKATR